MLHGGTTECAALDRLLVEAQAGRSQVLVLPGQPGIGKTALLDHLAERVVGCRVIRAAGVESEMELTLSGLHQLGGPFTAHEMCSSRSGWRGSQSGHVANCWPPARACVGVAPRCATS